MCLVYFPKYCDTKDGVCLLQFPVLVISGDDVGPVCFPVLVMLKMDWVLSSSQFL